MALRLFVSAKVISAKEPGEIGLVAEVIDEARLHVATERQVTRPLSRQRVRSAKRRR